LAEFGLHNLREHELERVGVAREAWESACAAQSRAPSALDESVDVGERMHGLRQALRGLLSATATASSKVAISTRAAAYEALRDSLSAGEKARVVAAALARQKDAPEGHFLKRLDLKNDFNIAVSALGMNVVYSVLDSAPEENTAAQGSAKTIAVPVDTLRWLLGEAEELKEMKEEINDDYSSEDLANWDARLQAVEQIIQAAETPAPAVLVPARGAVSAAPTPDF